MPPSTISVSAASSPSPTAASSDAAPPALVVGIDFGTFASGFAYRKTTSSDTAVGLSGAAAAASLRVSTHDRWPDQPAPDAKTRTALLYQGSKVVAWGWTAWKRWSEMSSQERRTGPYTYLENFKLLLEDGAVDDVDTVCPLPPGVTRVQAVADYLGEMRKYIREQLRRSAGVTSSLTTDEVLWCLTVPAIWSEPAKARMREAAHRAGLTVRTDSRSLTLTLEPEAAALSAVMMGQQQQQGTTGLRAPGTGLGVTSNGYSAGSGGNGLRDGDVLLVLDCGGGTADVTVHRVRGSGAATRLEEAAMGRGALAGGAHVDSAAWSYIRDLLGPQQWDDWKEAHPDELVKLKSKRVGGFDSGKWELSKRSFLCNRSPAVSSSYSATATGSGDTNSTLLSGMVKVAGVQRNDIRLPLPPGLVSTMGQHALRALSWSSDSRGWVGADQSLVLPAEVVSRQIFDPVVVRIISLMRGAMDDGRRLGNPCNKVLLAGGFARSPYLQSRVRAALAATYTPLLLPADPGAAVVTGAVISGAFTDVITARRCRASYGVRIDRVWTTEDATCAAIHNYPRKSWHNEHKKYYAGDVYDRFVEVGQLVQVGEVVQHPFTPMYKTASSVAFDLYKTGQPSARYTAESGMEKLATVILELPPGWSRNLASSANYSLQAEMRFGATELSLVARDRKTNNAVAATILWDADMA
ncbi:hypothetical protein PLESTM_000241700 [Pleodorina starrii]|nr:hypothetical protein PLESTM_000241700 [Pleodorina starrii]